MKLSLHDAAQEGAESQIGWYQARSEQAAFRLGELISDGLVAISTDPWQFSLMEWRFNRGNIRRIHIQDFPILIIYQVLADEVFVIAVAHASQRSGYWRSRLRKG